MNAIPLAEPLVLVEPISIVTDSPAPALHAARSRAATDSSDVRADEHSAIGLVELLLKAPGRVDLLTRDAARQPELVTRFLAIALVCLTVFGVAATVVLNAASSSVPWPRFVPVAQWNRPSAANLVIAYNLGLVATIGVCLPSFYFYGLLAGVRTTMLEVVTHAIKGLAMTSIILVGIVPIYVALVLGIAVLNLSPTWTQNALYVALALPFLAGLGGMHNLYVGFTGLCDRMPPAQRERRGCFLRRLVFAWSACYTAVAPLMVVTLWRHLPS